MKGSIKNTLNGIVIISLLWVVVAGCVVLPQSRNHTLSCGVSTDKLTLRVVDVAKESNTYYSLSGLIATPIVLPTTAVASAIYAATYNTYITIAQEKITCQLSG